MARILLSVLLSALGWSFFVSAQLQCYYPDGTLAPNDTPCNAASTSTSDTISPCCGNMGLCLDNGLCMTHGLLYRGSCTSKTWGAACFQHCIGDEFNPSGAYPLSPCNDLGSLFQCNISYPSTKSPCNPSTVFKVSGGSAVVLRPYQVNSSEGLEVNATTILDIADSGPAAPSSSSSATSASKTNSPTSSSASTSPTCSQTQSYGYSAGAVAGAIVGVAVPLLLALGCAVFVILKQREEVRRSKQLREVSRDTGANGFASGKTERELQTY